MDQNNIYIAYHEMVKNNPQFRRFVEENKNETTERIAEKYQISLFEYNYK